MHFHRHKKPADGYGLDVLWPPEGESDHQSNVDIVFVHGLGGRRHSTWMKNEVLWPVDLLAKDFPNARIMTWGYDSRIMAFFGPVGQGSVHSHANELNNDLSSERGETHQVFRPLIFFAHSLGGLIVKNALFRSWLEYVSESRNKDRSAAIERSTIAVIFAGTPHRGSDKAKWASLATKMATVIHKDHSTRLSDALKQGSDVVETLQDWFKKIENNFHVFSFFEEVPVHKIGPIVESESAAIHCQHEKRRMIHANHMEMVRFDNKDCNEYKKVKDAFRQIHQYEVSNIVNRDITQPPRRLSVQGRMQNSIEDERPHTSSQHRLSAPSQQRLPGTPQLGLLEYRASQMSLGQNSNLRVEEVVESAPRRSSDHTPNAGLTANALGRLTHHASTTTLATMTSTHSHRSDHSNRSNEGQSAVSTQSQSQLRSQYLSLLQQGRRYARRGDKNFLSNLQTAKSCFQQALELLAHPSFTSPWNNNASSASSTLSAHSARSQSSITSSTQAIDRATIRYQLMNVEFNMSFHKPLSSEEKLSHLSSAEQHGWDASGDARRASAMSPGSPAMTNSTSNPDSANPSPFYNPASYFPPQAGNPAASSPRPTSSISNGEDNDISTHPETLLAQVQLYLAVIKGRKAELHSRLSVSPEAIKRQKEDAASDMDTALAKIISMAPTQVNGDTSSEAKWVRDSEEFARVWRERLIPPSASPLPTPNPLPTAPATTPMATPAPAAPPNPTPSPTPHQVPRPSSYPYSPSEIGRVHHHPANQPQNASYPQLRPPQPQAQGFSHSGTGTSPQPQTSFLTPPPANQNPGRIMTNVSNNNPSAYYTTSPVSVSAPMTGHPYEPYYPHSNSASYPHTNNAHQNINSNGHSQQSFPVAELWGETTAWATGTTARLPTYSEVGGPGRSSGGSGGGTWGGSGHNSYPGGGPPPRPNPNQSQGPYATAGPGAALHRTGTTFSTVSSSSNAYRAAPPPAYSEGDWAG